MMSLNPLSQSKKLEKKEEAGQLETVKKKWQKKCKYNINHNICKWDKHIKTEFVGFDFDKA